MVHLPVIVGFGGYNAAGRSSFHHGFRRMILDALTEQERQQTLLGLATLTGRLRYSDGHYVMPEGLVDEGVILPGDGAPVLPESLVEQLKSATLVRYLEEPTFEFSDVWYEKIAVRSAGSLPDGFEPGSYYRSNFHPKGLQLAVLAASDALYSTGMDWQSLMQAVAPDQVAVYSSSLMGQLDEPGYGGLMQSRLKGKRQSAKQLAMGFNSMPTDFINAYVLGSVGATGTVTGACASFLYNLDQGIRDIQSGRRRIVVVGNSEAPLTREIIDGYSAMGALATAANLRQLDGVDNPDYRRACRPFSANCGFTLGESAQYVVLMDDSLALELGANIHGCVTDVSIHADGIKRSISSPGAGNYISLAKAVASACALWGKDYVQQNSWVQAHGSSTPQNRVTESAVLNKVAQGFGFQQWPVTAVKSYVGHSLAPASADQLVASLGTFAYQRFHGIKTIDHIAEDVEQSHLAFILDDAETDKHIAFLNSKGFGGNNASAVLASSALTLSMLAKRYDDATLKAYHKANETVNEQAQAYNQQAIRGELNPLYRYGEDTIDEAAINITETEVKVPGFDNAINLSQQTPYSDLK